MAKKKDSQPEVSLSELPLAYLDHRIDVSDTDIFVFDRVAGKTEVPMIDLKLFKMNEPNAVHFEPTEMGMWYHVVLLGYNRYRDAITVDSFDAVLSSPLVYIKNMVRAKLGGMIIKAGSDGAIKRRDSFIMHLEEGIEQSGMDKRNVKKPTSGSHLMRDLH